MLTALHDDVRVYAAKAVKGRRYLCPGCRGELILRQGRIRIHHFAHRPPVGCLLGRGETDQHLAAKALFQGAFAPRSFKTEVEWPIPSLAGDRRADVFVWDLAGGQVAIELQHTGIGVAEIELRTRGYLAAAVPVVWVPFLRAEALDRAIAQEGGSTGNLVIENYRPRPFERWLDGYAHGDLWFYEPGSGKLYRGKFDRKKSEPQSQPRPQTQTQMGFGEAPADPWRAPPPRGRRLRLWGPIDPAALVVRRFIRREAARGRHGYPGGLAANFTVTAR